MITDTHVVNNLNRNIGDKAQLIKRLETDIEEIRLYLNRPNPNIEDALERVAISQRALIEYRETYQ